MSSAPFPAAAVLEACRQAAVEFSTGARSGPDRGDGIVRITALQTLAEKVIESANRDFHATVSVDAEEMVLIAPFLKFDGAPPLAAELPRAAPSPG